MLHMPNRIELMIVGMSCSNALNAISFIVVIPEISEATVDGFCLRHLPPEMGDKVGAVFSFSISVGSVLYPLSMGYMVEILDYRWCTDVFGLVGLSFSLLYLFVVYDKGMFSLQHRKQKTEAQIVSEP